MKKILFYLFLLMLIDNHSSGQDFHFSQFYAGPLNLNPAFTGTSELTRVGINYRKQWPGLEFNFNGYSAYIDHYSFDINSGFGLVVNAFNEQNMAINTTEIGFFYAYNLKLSENSNFRFGSQTTYARRSGNLENLVFGDQIDVFSRSINPNSIDLLQNFDPFGYLDLGFGMLFTSEFFWLGLSGHHLNNPKMYHTTEVDFEFLPKKIGIQAGVQIPLRGNDYWSSNGESHIALMSNFKQQGPFSQMDFSAQTKMQSFIFGLGFRGMYNSKGLRNYDSLIGILGVGLENGLVIGYSYDWIISQVSVNTRGSHEFSLRYQFLAGLQRYRGQRKRILKCLDYSF